MKKKFFTAMLLCTAFIFANAQNVSSGCYRGFTEAGYTVGIGDYDFGRFEVKMRYFRVYTKTYPETRIGIFKVRMNFNEILKN